jgi:phenylalanyl-tRNA synthetase beta chain
MKVSEQWLREWIDPRVDVHALGNKLTSLGLEVESIESVGNDQVIELGITPNRGDCFSILGVARELSVAFGLPVKMPRIPPIEATLNETLPIRLAAPEACPHYSARIFRGVNSAAPTPEWMKGRLEKAGMQSVNLIADITNYVMLELGQPMHAFDLAKIQGGITLRMSQGETITLLNQSEVTLPQNTLVIADDHQVLAVAGVMGGLESSVTLDTKDILLESAFFNPDAILGCARRLSVHSEGAQRFERGVDPALAHCAMDRASQLILELAGGHTSEVFEAHHPDFIPTQAEIRLPHAKLCSLLGMEFSTEHILGYFLALNMPAVFEQGIYQVKAPSYRFDMKLPEDLIEEVIRIVGYDQIPEAVLSAVPGVTPSESAVSLQEIKSVLIDRGYHEVITYSFVDKQGQERLFPGEATQELLNPISPEMGSMRLSLWPGLLKTLEYNQNRQMGDLRIFEIGQCFPEVQGKLAHSERLAGLISGLCHPPHWGLAKRPVDFFDAKGDVEALLTLSHASDYSFVSATHPALAPGQTAAIYQGKTQIGWIGALHPQHAKAFDLKLPVFVYELQLANLLTKPLPQNLPLSKFPAIRRDLALLVDAQVESRALLALAQEKAGRLLKQIEIFDVYQGEGIEKGKKSIALGLILQDSSRTLIDEEVNDLIQAVVQGLEHAFQATVRE